MKVALAPVAVPGQRLAAVTVVLGVRQPIPEAASKQRITERTELQISAFTPEGDPRGTQRHTANVVLRAGSDGEAAYEVLGRIDLPPGRYRLRLGAHNTTSSKDGSVFADVVVPDYSNLPASASPVILSATPGRASAPRELLSSLLPLVPTAERDFTTADRVTALLRLYQNGQRTAERAEIGIRVRNEADAVVATGAMAIAAGDFSSAGFQESAAAAPQAGRRGILGPPQAASRDQFANLSLRTAEVRYPLPLSTLAAGQYLLTFDVTIGATNIRRELRFSSR
jgi:hypothetical protein